MIPGERGGNALTPRFWPENRRRRASLQPYGGPPDIDGDESPVGRLGGQGLFDQHSQPLQQFPGHGRVG